ncbi:MAG: methyltransferase type 11, partial [Gemmatimonadota bacterium]|nr:methyltransferase type 11 [Gemmatimonadota bacterium]
SDVFSGRRVPEALRSDPVLLGECLGGALYTEDFRRLLRGLGVLDHRVVSRSRLDLRSTEVEVKAGMIDFYSMTVRAFKLPLEDICEDYGQVAYYLGTIPEAPHAFTLDNHHVFRMGMPVLVCGNTASMLQDTRFGRHFRMVGDHSVHYGAFACGPAPAARDSAVSGGCC